jgi:hypothetical protein
LAQVTLADLRSGHPGLVQDATLLAASFFELSCGHANPADPTVRTDPASADELVALRDALIDVVNAPPDPELVGGALWALGKLPDRSLIPFFVRWLTKHRHGDPSATMQALIGLNNHGEPTLGPEGHLSDRETELILRQADHYLREIGAI